MRIAPMPIILLLVASVVGWFSPLWWIVALSVVALFTLIWGRSINDGTGNETAGISRYIMVLALALGAQSWLGYGARYLFNRYTITVEERTIINQQLDNVVVVKPVVSDPNYHIVWLYKDQYKEILVPVGKLSIKARENNEELISAVFGELIPDDKSGIPGMTYKTEKATLLVPWDSIYEWRTWVNEVEKDL